MLGEYKVNRCTRRCHALDRPLREGEWYYSVVVEAGHDYQRRDYSAESWQGPPEGALGWWKNQMPRADQKKMVLAPNEVLVELLRQMASAPARAKSRYLLALMLMRRKVVQPCPAARDTESADTESADTESAGTESAGTGSAGSGTAGDPTSDEILSLRVVADGSTINVPVCAITRGESASLRQELDELLYCEADQ